MGNCNKATSDSLLVYKQNFTVKVMCQGSFKNMRFHLAGPVIDRKEAFQIPNFNLKFSICITPEQDFLKEAVSALKIQEIVVSKPDCVMTGFIDASGPAGQDLVNNCKVFIKDYFLINEITDHKEFILNTFNLCEQSLINSGIDRTTSSLSLTIILILKDAVYSACVGNSKATLSSVPMINPDFHTFKASRKSFCPSRMLNVLDITPSSSVTQKNIPYPGNSISNPTVNYHPLIVFRDLFLTTANSAFWKVISLEDSSCFVEYFRGFSGIGRDVYISEKNSSVSRLAIEEVRSRFVDLNKENGCVIEELALIVVEIVSRNLWERKVNFEESEFSSCISSGIYGESLRNTSNVVKRKSE